jgi:hypothetical protein
MKRVDVQSARDCWNLEQRDRYSLGEALVGRLRSSTGVGDSSEHGAGPELRRLVSTRGRHQVAEQPPQHEQGLDA